MSSHPDGSGRDLKRDPYTVLVVSPYRYQVATLRSAVQDTERRLGQRLYSNEFPYLRVTYASVDGCQGREADFVVFSCVRAADKPRSIGFLSDVRRMNVAITRAKRGLWVVGDAKTLRIDPTWQAWTSYCERMGWVRVVPVPPGRDYAAVPLEEGHRLRRRIDQGPDLSPISGGVVGFGTNLEEGEVGGAEVKAPATAP